MTSLHDLGGSTTLHLCPAGVSWRASALESSAVDVTLHDTCQHVDRGRSHNTCFEDRAGERLPENQGVNLNESTIK